MGCILHMPLLHHMENDCSEYLKITIRKENTDFHRFPNVLIRSKYHVPVPLTLNFTKTITFTISFFFRSICLEIPGQTGPEIQEHNPFASDGASGGMVTRSNRDQQGLDFKTRGQSRHSGVLDLIIRTWISGVLLDLIFHGQATMAGLGPNRRQVSVTLCTSSYEFNIQGLLDHLRDLQQQTPHLIKNVTYHQLPYNNIDKHKFAKGNQVDVMILCHSIANRRFAITDVADACYDKFLPNCKKLLGDSSFTVDVLG